MQGGITYGFCPGVSITGSLTINEEMSPTIRAQANTNTPAIAVRTAQTTANGCGVSDELAHTIDTTGPEAIAYAVRMRAGCDGGGKGALVQEGVSGTLATGNDQTLFQPESGGYVVRRLTPLECERLQGMPGNHTKVPYRGKPAEECPDGPRYKAIGNSMAVPVMRWIGERVQEVDALLSSEGDADSKNNQEKSD